jgi:hypothetical protein
LACSYSSKIVVQWGQPSQPLDDLAQRRSPKSSSLIVGIHHQAVGAIAAIRLGLRAAYDEAAILSTQ